MLGAQDPDSVDESAGDNHFKPLEHWFDAKEQSIQNLTNHLEKLCQQMCSLNETVSAPSELEGHANPFKNQQF